MLGKRHNAGMAGTDAFQAPAREEAQPRKRRPAHVAPAHPAAGPSLTALQFPGCTPYRLTREQIGDFEGRLEFWDAATETAWVCEPLGARGGTGPDDDPLLRAQRRRGFDEGRVRGHAEGRAELLRQILLSRGIEVSEGFPATVASALAEWPEDDRVVAAALACESEADFLARLRSPGS